MSFDRRTSSSRGKIPWAAPAMIITVAVLVIWPVWAGLYTDWLWFQDLNYGVVFSTVLGTQAMLGLAVGLFAAAFAWLNFRLAVRLSPTTQHFGTSYGTPEEGTPLSELAAMGGMIHRFIIPASLAIGVFAGMFASSLAKLRSTRKTSKRASGQSRTFACGISNPCSTPSGRSRRFARITSSMPWTMTVTG